MSPSKTRLLSSTVPVSEFEIEANAIRIELRIDMQFAMCVY